MDACYLYCDLHAGQCQRNGVQPAGGGDWLGFVYFGAAAVLGIEKIGQLTAKYDGAFLHSQ